jgi:hypothetical protein
MSWKQRDGEYPFWDELPEELIPVFDPEEGSPPLSYVMVQKSGEYPYLTGQSLIPMSVPYPVSIMVQKAGSYPKIDGLNKIDIGAFCHCYQLKSISIPTSVKNIGQFTFYNTQLSSVRISSDCTYWSTSFPPGCQVIVN